MPLQHFKVLSFDVVGTLLDLERAADDATWYPDDLEREWHAVGPALGLPDNLHVAQSQYHDIGVARRLGIDVCWIERRHAQMGSGGTLESEHTVPDFHFHALAELADAVDAGR